MPLQPGQHVHLVGIGGFGLSAIARVLLERGYTVSGSDWRPNALTDQLAHDGATIFTGGHNPAHIAGADLLVVSSAVHDNPEVEAARSAGIPVYKRRDIMAALMHGFRVIAVAGTHGKTTTTAMIIHILRECGIDPSYIVGGVMGNTATNAHAGTGDVFVVEADEYDNMFLGLKPDVIVLTSIEYDHPDFFKTPADMLDSFRRFIDLLPRPHGQLFACTDYPLVRHLLDERGLQPGSNDPHGFAVGSYGLNPSAIYRADNIYVDADGFTVFDVLARIGENASQARVGTVRLPLPGTHNVQNALGAVFACTLETAGMPSVLARHAYAALATFKGTGRRFEVRGVAEGVIVVDDYAHHPTAISATLAAARSLYRDHALWAVWQPHTFSRTSQLQDGYATAFTYADHVLITDVYPAREAPPPGTTATQYTAQVARAIQHPSVTHTPTLPDAVQALRQQVRPPAVILILSAGDAPQIGVQYLAQA